MAARTMVVAPHPDDEILGVGGTLLRRRAEGTQVAWLIVTGISVETGWSAERVARRDEEIRAVSDAFGFHEVFALGFPTTRLDSVPMGDLVGAISRVVEAFEPDEVFLPHPSDVHTDHAMAYHAVASCTKWFRYPSVRRVLAYETLSETDFGLGTASAFRPNVFIDIAPFLEAKLQALDIYASEVGAFPFPRSHDALRALAMVRGAASGFQAAEAFELLRERI